MKFVLTLLGGIVLGALLTYFLFVGAPRMTKLPGTPVAAPDAAGDPPGTALLTLDEKFFGTLLDSIFRDMGQPTFRLAGMRDGSEGAARDDVRFVPVQQQQGGCINQVVLAREGGGVQTSVRLANGKIVAPLAFSGSYQFPVGPCLNFRGSAQANVALSFKQEEQTLYGQINVEGVNLEGYSPLLSGVVTQFVQNAINQRVNPLVIMRGQQLALAIPIQATGGTLRAQAKDIRSEANDGV
ncbi:MAG: hypothetical protein H0V88_10455, partial [Pyrinomonadaceae bacterium]|nr:hypothetical protein [Pyrinomonadaceae bacterium]